jgi:hypothetical protein
MRVRRGGHWSAALIHKHHAGLSPRLIPGSSPRSALHFLLPCALPSKKLTLKLLITKRELSPQVWPERIRGGRIRPDQRRVIRQSGLFQFEGAFRYGFQRTLTAEWTVHSDQVSP